VSYVRSRGPSPEIDVTTLLLFLALALADEGPVSPDEPFVFRVGTEAEGQADDRTLKRVEAAVRALEPTLSPCRIEALKHAEQPRRHLGLQVKLKPSTGGFRWVKITSSTGIPTVDACIIDGLQSVRLDPKPGFADRFQLHLTWSKQAQDDED
jgi:hypothetical protein